MGKRRYSLLYGLGLGVAPDLTLVGLGDRDVGGLSTTVAHSVAEQLGGGGCHQGREANEGLKKKNIIVRKISMKSI